MNRRNHKRAPRDLSPAAAALAVAAALAPFAGKAYHIDDTIFLRLARQIAEHPLRPFDFFYAWGLTPIPAWLMYLNPPLDSYYLAFVRAWAHEREVWTHLAFLPFGAACAALSVAISRRLCRRESAAAAAAAALAGPAFLVSATNVMADVPLLCFWLAGVFCTLLAVEPGQEAWLWVGAAAATAAAMTKYFGLALVPLCLIYVLAKTRRINAHLLSFLCAPLVLTAWSFYSKSQSGFHHPLASGQFALGARPLDIPQGLILASFLGGGALWPLALLFRPRGLRAAAGAAVAAAVFAALTAASVPAPARAEWIVFSAAGGLLTATSIAGALARPDAEALLLTLWLFGTLAFAGLVNWTVNERALLPAFLPAALLTARLLESSAYGRRTLSLWPWAATPTLALSLVLAAADAGQAGAGRSFAQGPARALLSEGRPVFFIGHWGFQYYMEREGARPFDYRAPDLPTGARLCVSLNNSGTLPTPSRLRSRLVLERYLRAANPAPAALTDAQGLGAGFYNSANGPVPFSFGRLVDADDFVIQSVAAPAPR